MPIRTDLKVLVVDDSDTIRRVHRKIVLELGIKVVDEAEDGVIALKKLKTTSYDLIILDWNMPNMLGIDVLKTIRADMTLKNTKVLMVTAEGSKENVVEAIKCGANNYIIKPFNADTVGEKIQKLFA